MQQVEASYNPPIARQTARPTVSYGEYVQAHAGQTARYGFLVFLGVGLAVGAGMYLDGPFMVILAALGLGLGGGGGAGLTAALSAHAAYTRHLGMITTTAYQEKAPTPAPAQRVGRAFVPSTNGAANTIHVGPHWLTGELWEKLRDTADRDGKITRDRATKALPRPLYREWASTLSELQRLGLVDDDGYLTPLGKLGLPPYPTEGDGTGQTTSTHARRTHGVS